MNKTLMLIREFNVKNFARILELISQYNLIYTDSDLRITISNEFIDDTTLYLSIFKLHEKLKDVIGTIENPFYILTFHLYKPVSPNTLEKILELTQIDSRIKPVFIIKIKNDTSVLSVLDTLNKYSTLLPGNSYFSNIELIIDDQPKDFFESLFQKLKSYNRKDISIIPTFRKEIVSDEYVNKVISILTSIYSEVPSPDLILETHRKIYGCNVQWDEIPIIFKDDKVYSTYCGNSCCMSSNPEYSDSEHLQIQINNMDDIRSLSYIALKPNDKLPGYISCPLQNTSDDYMLINAYMNKVQEILYKRYKN